MWVITAIIAYLLPIPLWALEWRLLAPRTARVAYSKMFEVVAVMAAVLNSIPFFAGETAGVGMLIGRAGLSRGAALSVLALDQLLSGVVKLVVLGTAALLVPLPVWLRSGILALVILRPPGGWSGDEARRLLDRFSPAAIGAFGITVVFGFIQALQDVGRLSAIFSSPYGRVLGVKVIAVGLAMYWFLRGLALRPLAACVGATAFMFSTTVIAWLPWTFASTMPFLPVLFGLVDRIRARGDRRLVALLALAVALDLLAGYPQAALQALAATAAWALARAPWRAGAPAFLARVVGGVALGVALTAAQALPALDYVRESTVYAFRSTWTPPLAVPPRAMVTALMPYFFGTGSSTWSVWQFNITSTYVGLVPLAALPLAAAMWRRLPARFFVGLALVAGLVHYGALAAVAPAPLIAFGSNLRLIVILDVSARIGHLHRATLLRRDHRR